MPLLMDFSTYLPTYMRIKTSMYLNHGPYGTISVKTLGQMYKHFIWLRIPGGKTIFRELEQTKIMTRCPCFFMNYRNTSTNIYAWLFMLASLTLDSRSYCTIVFIFILWPYYLPISTFIFSKLPVLKYNYRFGYSRSSYLNRCKTMSATISATQ